MKIGITLISVFLLFLFATTVFVTASLLLFKDEIRKELEKQIEIKDINYNQLILLTTLIGIFSAILYLSAALGLLMLKEWGRKIALIISSLHIVYGILVIKFIYFAIPNLTMGFLIFVYLNQKDVKAEFKKKTTIEERILGVRID